MMPTREGFEVFPNTNGTITIQQEGLMGCAPSTVAVHPADVDTLISFLHQAKAELEEEPAEETVPGFSASTTFIDACILGVSLTTNGFQGGDAGHGGETLLTLKDQSSTAMDLINVEEGQFTIRFRGDAELRVLARAIHYLDHKLQPFR
jgi:hypothetical protein